MDPKAPETDPLEWAYRAALAEEHRLRRDLHGPVLKPTEWVVTYARWRSAAKRLNDLAIRMGLPGTDSEH